MANKITYCPCCGEEFEDVSICPDCDKQTLPGPRPKDFSRLCGCDGPLPENHIITTEGEGENMGSRDLKDAEDTWDEQLYRGGEPQVYCADCFYYGDGRTFPGDVEMDIVQCPDCGGERTFALTQSKKNEIDAMF